MILQTLDSFLTAERALGARGPWVVAFSGGGDSTALAAGLAELAPRQGVDLQGASQQRHRCLLYTSDAADE